MIAFIWIVFALAFVVWTASMWIAASLAKWTADALAAGTQPAPFLIKDAVGHAAPEWLSLWLGPLLLELAQSGFSWVTYAFEALLPWAGTAVGWMVPLIWGVWFVVSSLMIMIAVAAHVLLRRARRLAIPTHAARLRPF